MSRHDNMNVLSSLCFCRKKRFLKSLIIVCSLISLAFISLPYNFDVSYLYERLLKHKRFYLKLTNDFVSFEILMLILILTLLAHMQTHVCDWC